MDKLLRYIGKIGFLKGEEITSDNITKKLYERGLGSRIQKGCIVLISVKDKDDAFYNNSFIYRYSKKKMWELAEN